MRTELWGLKNKETGELVLEYFASSQKHKALFSSHEKAQKACKWRHNAQLEPFKIESVSVVRCKDCKWFTMDNTGGTYCNHLTCGLFNGYEPDAFCSYGERKESNE